MSRLFGATLLNGGYNFNIIALKEGLEPREYADKLIDDCDPRIDEIIKTACELNNFRPSHHSLYIYGFSYEEREAK